MKILFLFCDMLRADLLKTVNPLIKSEKPIDKWFKRIGGTCFTNAYTPAPDTPRSMACFYTGLYPKNNGCCKYAQYPRYWLNTKNHIFRTLSNNGYEIMVYSSIKDYIDGVFPLDIIDCNATITISFKETIKKIKENQSKKQAILITLPDYHDAIDMMGRELSGDEEGQSHLSNSFALLFESLPIEDFDKIVIFSDHGCRLKIDDQTELGWLNDNRVKTVLFVHEKGDTDIIKESRVVSILDVFPTVLEWLGNDLPTDLDGQSLLHPTSDRFIITEDEIFQLSDENYLGSVANIWTLRNNPYCFTETLNDGFKLQKFDNNGYIDCTPDSKLLTDFRKKIGENACFYEINKRRNAEIQSLVGTRKQTKNLFEDAKYSDLVGKDIDSFYNSKGYLICYTDGEPLVRPRQTRFIKRVIKRILADKMSAFLMKSTFMPWYLNSDSYIARFARFSYRGLLNQIKRRNTIRELKEISEIFYHYGCVWSLQSANVLGIQRNGKLRANEDDVDIAVLAETWHTQVEEAIRQKGFNLSVYCGGYYEGSEGVHYVAKKQGLIFDIYPSFKDRWDNITYRWYGGDHPSRYYFEPRLLEQTRTVKFYGFDVEIPADTETYLRAIYGEDYIIPNDNWDWRTMPKCRLQLKPTYLSQADVERYQIGKA